MNLFLLSIKNISCSNNTNPFIFNNLKIKIFEIKYINEIKKRYWILLEFIYLSKYTNGKVIINVIRRYGMIPIKNKFLGIINSFVTKLTDKMNIITVKKT